MPYLCCGSQKPNDVRLFATARTRAIPNVGRGRDASSSDRKLFPDNALAGERFFGQRPIRFKYQLNSFLKVVPSLVKRRALRVRAGQFFDKSRVTFRDFNEHCGPTSHIEMITLR